MAGETVASDKSLHIPLHYGAAPCGWAWSRLDDMCTGVFDCPHSTPTLTECGPYVARTQDITTGRFRFEQAAHVSEATYTERIARVTPSYGDLLYSREGTYFGIAAEVPKATSVCLGQRMVLMRPDDQRLNHSFLRYWLNSPAMASHIHGYRDGTVAERLNLPTIRALPVIVPPLPEQKRIAHVLGTLDDKIELNRRMNATLEALSRAIFKSWFVDFDPVRQKAAGKQPVGIDAKTASLFPDSFEDSEIGEVPRGWALGRLGDVAEQVRRAARPEEIASGTPYIGLEHMPRCCITLSDWSDGNSVESNKSGFQRGEILFGKLRPYFHKVGVAPIDGVCSTDIVVARPASKLWFGFVLGHMSSDAFVAFTNAGSTGTKMPRTSWDEMSRYEVALPSSGVAEVFTDCVQAAVDSMTARVFQSRTLAALRDALLPKLLSGEVRVPEAEGMVEEAVG